MLCLSLVVSACSPKPEPKSSKTCPIHSYDNSKLPKGVLSFRIPKSWQEVPVTNPMRLREFIVDSGNNIRLSVYFFPGIEQSPSLNTKRWKEQFQDDESRILLENKQFNFDKLPVTIYHIKGNYKEKSNPMDPSSSISIQKNYSLLATMVEFKDGTWFFKITGPSEIVLKQRTNLDYLIHSFQRTDHK